MLFIVGAPFETDAVCCRWFRRQVCIASSWHAFRCPSPACRSRRSRQWFSAGLPSRIRPFPETVPARSVPLSRRRQQPLFRHEAQLFCPSSSAPHDSSWKRSARSASEGRSGLLQPREATSANSWSERTLSGTRARKRATSSSKTSSVAREQPVFFIIVLLPGTAAASVPPAVRGFKRPV